jgi:monoterpene epsilon-lactone hydrolase
MVSPALEQAIQVWKDLVGRAMAIGTVEGFRVTLEELGARFPAGPEIQTEKIGAAGVPAEWITPPGAESDRVLLYLHGGGYMCGSIRTHRDMIARIARAAGIRALAIEYRLAPENPFPAAVQDAVAVYRWLLSRGIQSKNIVIGGDSAGGGLTVSTLVALRYTGEPLPAAGICISPWTDMTNTAESITTKAALDPCVQRDALEAFASAYLGTRDRQTPLASPLYADLRGLPPLLIQVGTSETILDDSTRLAERAKDAGIEATLDVWDDMVHVWHLFASFLPEGQRAIEKSADFIRSHIGTRSALAARAGT